MSDIRLQLLLKKPLDDASFRKIEEALAKIGAEITGRGAVTMSARMEPGKFASIFATPPAGAASLAHDFAKNASLPVPRDLEDLVESISEAPIHLRMKD